MLRMILLCAVFTLRLANAASAAEVNNQPLTLTVMGAQGIPLAVQEWGNPDGLPVIFLHGYGFGANAFKNQIGNITKDLRLIAFDLRGHGLSAKPWAPEAYNDSKIWAEDLSNVLTALDVKKPILVGWSFGGYVAMHYIRHFGSDAVSGVVLVGSLAGLTDQPPPPDPKDAGLPPPKGNSRIDTYHDVFENYHWLARVMTHAAPANHLLEQKKMTLAMMPPYVKRATLGMPLDNRDLVEKVTAPVLFLHGDKDGSVPATYVQMAVDALPDAASKLYGGGVGHSPMEEQPEQFNADLLSFAKKHAR